MKLHYCIKIRILLIAIIPVIIVIFCSFKQIATSSYLDYAPFPKKEYQNRINYYRCAGTGKSTDVNLAHEKALYDAKSRLIKAILNSYNDNFAVGKNELMELVLQNIKIVDEKVIKSSGHTNICWLIIQVRKRDIKEKLKKEFKKIEINTVNINYYFNKYNIDMKKQKNIDY